MKSILNVGVYMMYAINYRKPEFYIYLTILIIIIKSKFIFPYTFRSQPIN